MSHSDPPRPAAADIADDPVRAASGGADLRRLVARGLGWMMASQGTVQLFGFVTSVVIAHLLSPREVGLAAMCIVFGTLALVIADFGVASVIVQRPSLTETDTSTAFWSSLALGLVLTAAGVGLSWPIADLYGQPRVQPLFAVLSLTFLFTAPGIVQGALLTRELKFRQLEARTIVAVAVSCATAITLAALGLGPWAIIIQSLTISGVSTLLLWRSSPWRPRLAFSRQSLRDMSGFASHTFGARALGWGTLNGDNLLVGRFIGASSLGIYSLACSVALTPLRRIADPITQVFFPAFSRIRDPEQIGAVWLRALQMVAVIVIPTMLGVIVVAHDFVVVVFGQKWIRVVPVLQLMAVVGLLQALTTLNNGILQSTGQSRTLVRCTVMVSVATILAFVAGLPLGIIGIAAIYLGVSLVVQPLFTAITARTVGLTLGQCVAAIAGPLQAGLGMMAVVLGARELLVSAGTSATARLIILVGLGVVTYVPLVAWRAPEVRREVRRVMQRRAVRTTSGVAAGTDPVPGG
jgi:O-antigen/teichoic acid export membrane protein